MTSICHQPYDVYVSPSGTPEGAGTRCDPLNLANVAELLHYLVFPGVRIHLLAGLYVGDFGFAHSGVDGANIEIIFEDGAQIKGSLTLDVERGYLVVRNLYAYNEAETRWTDVVPNGPPGFAQRNGLTIFANDSIAVHPFVRDVIASGIGFWQSATNSVLYGAWIVNHGWDAPDRGHGHAVYQQGEHKLTRNCVFAQGYGGGIRSYTTTQNLSDIEIDRCITINDVLLHGGNAASSGITVTNNVTWNQYLEIGETSLDNDDVLIDGNYTVGKVGTEAMVLRYWKNPVITNNVFVSRKDPIIGMASIFQIRLHDAPESFVCDNNTYYVEDPNYTTTRFLTITQAGVQTAYTQAQWQALGRDVNSVFISGLPTANHVVINHSEYDDDIAHIAILNWEGLASVDVDFSGGNFTLTETYRAYNAMNYNEYHQFVYDGTAVPIPMTGWTRAIPVGATEPLTEDTWPTFGAFVVRAVPDVPQ